MSHDLPVDLHYSLLVEGLFRYKAHFIITLFSLGSNHQRYNEVTVYFKFGVPIDRQPYKPKNAKVGQKGSGLRHVTYFYNFGIRFISLEWVKLQTWSLVCGLSSRPANQKNAKVGQ